MRHPWIVAGRKRTATSGLAEKRPSSAQTTSRSYLPSSTANGIGSSGAGSGSVSGIGKPGTGGKQLVISPPTPLVAKAPPALTSKIGHSVSSSKLAQPMSRTGSFKTCKSEVCVPVPSPYIPNADAMLQKPPKTTFHDLSTIYIFHDCTYFYDNSPSDSGVWISGLAPPCAIRLFCAP